MSCCADADQAYRYELRHDGDTIATGHLSGNEPLQIGDQIEIAGSLGVIRSIEPSLGEQELRLVVEILPVYRP